MLKLAKPLLRSLDQGRTGVEFAEQIIQWADEGRMDYDRIRGIADALQKVGIPVEGKDDFEKFKNAVAMALQNIPEVWQRVGALPSFGQFLDEFYHYDEIVAAEQKDGAK